MDPRQKAVKPKTYLLVCTLAKATGVGRLVISSLRSGAKPKRAALLMMVATRLTDAGVILVGWTDYGDLG